MRRTKFLTVAVSLLLSVSAIAQDQQRVAIFDPVGNVPSFIRDIVREEISSVVVNTPGYIVLERALIAQVLQEDQFQATGLVDDAQVSEIGRRLGANLAFVTNITQMTGGNFHISARLIDVGTARVDRQQTALTTRGDADLVQVVNQLARGMFEQAAAVAPPVAQPVQQVAAPVAVVGNRLTANGRRVFQDGRRLSASEVRNVMAGTNALHTYNQGRRQATTGNLMLYPGAFMLGAGIGMLDVAPDHAPVIVGVGAGLMVYGFILVNRSGRTIGQSVHQFNTGATASTVELNFGVTQSGNIGLALNF